MYNSVIGETPIILKYIDKNKEYITIKTIDSITLDYKNIFNKITSIDNKIHFDNNLYWNNLLLNDDYVIKKEYAIINNKYKVLTNEGWIKLKKIIRYKSNEIIKKLITKNGIINIIGNINYNYISEYNQNNIYSNFNNYELFIDNTCSLNINDLNDIIDYLKENKYSEIDINNNIDIQYIYIYCLINNLNIYIENKYNKCYFIDQNDYIKINEKNILKIYNNFNNFNNDNNDNNNYIINYYQNNNDIYVYHLETDNNYFQCGIGSLILKNNIY